MDFSLGSLPGIEFWYESAVMSVEVDSTSGHLLPHTVWVFTTRVVLCQPDGLQSIFYSRRHRKGLPAFDFDKDGAAIPASIETNPWLRLWAPHRLAWWIALSFIVGSACFALGGFASSWPDFSPVWLVDSTILNRIFFVGSLFFTAAAWLQLLEAINGDVTDINASGHRRWRWVAWKPHNAGYSASLTQFVGTLLFNFNTADAMLAGLNTVEEELFIWAPDIVGSICFLVASYLALIEVSHRLWSFQPRDLSWWIALINMLGSIAFMLAAVFSFFMPGSGNALWLWGANFFTLAGAMCFLAASYLMIPELFGAGRVTDTRPIAPWHETPKEH